MRFYRATDVVKFYDGVILLTEKQIAGRKPNLEVGPGGKCKVKGEIQFKAGEVIGLEEAPKVYAKVLEPVETKKEAKDSPPEAPDQGQEADPSPTASKGGRVRGKNR